MTIYDPEYEQHLHDKVLSMTKRIEKCHDRSGAKIALSPHNLVAVIETLRQVIDNRYVASIPGTIDADAVILGRMVEEWWDTEGKMEGGLRDDRQ